MNRPTLAFSYRARSEFKLNSKRLLEKHDIELIKQLDRANAPRGTRLLRRSGSGKGSFGGTYELVQDQGRPSHSHLDWIRELGRETSRPRARLH